MERQSNCTSNSSLLEFLRYTICVIIIIITTVPPRPIKEMLTNRVDGAVYKIF